MPAPRSTKEMKAADQVACVKAVGARNCAQRDRPRHPARRANSQHAGNSPRPPARRPVGGLAAPFLHRRAMRSMCRAPWAVGSGGSTRRRRGAAQARSRSPAQAPAAPAPASAATLLSRHRPRQGGSLAAAARRERPACALQSRRRAGALRPPLSTSPRGGCDPAARSSPSPQNASRRAASSGMPLPAARAASARSPQQRARSSVLCGAAGSARCRLARQRAAQRRDATPQRSFRWLPRRASASSAAAWSPTVAGAPARGTRRSRPVASSGASSAAMRARRHAGGRKAGAISACARSSGAPRPGPSARCRRRRSATHRARRAAQGRQRRATRWRGAPHRPARHHHGHQPAQHQPFSHQGLPAVRRRSVARQQPVQPPSGRLPSPQRAGPRADDSDSACCVGRPAAPKPATGPSCTVTFRGAVDARVAHRAGQRGEAVAFRLHRRRW
jgi:hypothetical protein